MLAIFSNTKYERSVTGEESGDLCVSHRFYSGVLGTRGRFDVAI